LDKQVIKGKFVKNRDMVLVLKKGASTKDIEAIEKKLYKAKSSVGFNAKKYNGLMKLKGDPLTIQNRLRNEWERNFG
jgi:hypothetical protein